LAELSYTFPGYRTTHYVDLSVHSKYHYELSKMYDPFYQRWLHGLWRL